MILSICFTLLTIFPYFTKIDEQFILSINIMIFLFNILPTHACDHHENCWVFLSSTDIKHPVQFTLFCENTFLHVPTGTRYMIYYSHKTPNINSYSGFYYLFTAMNFTFLLNVTNPSSVFLFLSVSDYNNERATKGNTNQ